MIEHSNDERHVLHMDLDTFFVSVERLKDARLKGKPIIIGGTNGRGVVASCSYETRQYGVRSGMPMRTALAKCPEAIVIKGDHDHYSHYSDVISEIMAESLPVFEKASIDEFYADMTGMDRFFGCMQYAHEVRQTILKETGLPISMGLSVNKLVSKMGCGEAKPNGELNIDHGKEKGFIAPLHISKLPGVGSKTLPQLLSMGVKRIALLREIPRVYLEREFGQSGIALHKKAHAIDETPVIPYSERKSVSTERTFQVDTIDVRFLKAKLVNMTEQLAFELREKYQLTGCVTVKIRYTDFKTYTKQKVIPYTNQEKTLIESAEDVFFELYNRRQLVRLIGVKFSKLVPGNHQMDLFLDNLKHINLDLAVDQMRKRFGANAVSRAIGLNTPSK